MLVLPSTSTSPAPTTPLVAKGIEGGCTHDHGSELQKELSARAAFSRRMPYKNPSPQPTTAAVLGFPYRFYRSTASRLTMWWDDIHAPHMAGYQDESLEVS